MNKDKNIIIILMGVIIVILAVLCVLFATDTIVINKGESTSKVADTKENKSIKEETVETSKYTESEMIDMYSIVINEYAAALGDDKSGLISENVNIELNYLDFPTYEAFKEHNWYYSIYDIDNNGISELLISYTNAGPVTYNVVSIFTYNTLHEKVVDYWSRNKLVNIYDNGLIVSLGSNSATESIYTFGTISNINENVYDFTVYDDGTVVIMKDGNVTSYTNTIDLLNDYIKDANPINLADLTWRSVN